MTDDSDETLINDLLARFANLTEWEQGFVTDMHERIDAGFELTPVQHEKLEEIWEDRT